MTIRETVNTVVFDLLEFYTDKCFKEGENAEYMDVRLFDEPEKFVKGAFFNDVAHLCVYYKKTGDKRFDEAVMRLHFACDLIKNDKVRTWGKSSLLHGMCTLRASGLLGLLSEDEVSAIEEKSRYDDFLDPETVTLKGYPTNYYQVAMACAGMRELLGFENGGYCDKIKEKLFSVMQGFSDDGWMDENPPYGRFDRYTFMICAELSDTLYYINRKTPDFALNNLKNAFRLAIACANERGDGVIYGRSLSVHGDCAFLEIISTAMRLGIAEKEDIPVALAYSRAILRKTLDFWYDRDRRSFNLWLDGRTTNNYRQIHRLLEVNLDMCNHLLTTLANFEAAGYADTELDSLSIPNAHPFGNPYIVNYVNENDKVRTLYSFVNNGRLIQLPLISAGTMKQAAAYLPFPASVGELEAAPETQIPWLVPEYTTHEEGVKYLPAGFYDRIETANSEGKTVIRASGFLSELKNGGAPEKSRYRFNADYVFDNTGILMSFNSELKDARYRVIYARPYGARCYVTSDTEPTISNISDDKEFFTPHGRCTLLKEWTGNGCAVNIKITGL